MKQDRSSWLTWPLTMACKLGMHVCFRPTGSSNLLGHSKGVYEAKFKQWEYRKNFEKEEWDFIDCVMTKLKNGSFEAELYVRGVLIPKWKVDEQTRRYRSGSTALDIDPGTQPIFYSTLSVTDIQ